MSKILLIGGTGLISTPMTRQLLARGHAVTHLNRGKKAATPAGVAQVVADRQQFAAFEATVAASGAWDCVIDMCCFEPAEAESCVRAFQGRTKQFIFCSTVDVYARPTKKFPITEDEPLGGISVYGKKKVVCEQTMMAGHARGDFAVTVIRPVHTYHDGGGIHNATLNNAAVLGRLSRGLPIIMQGDGQSLWCAVHAEDCAAAFVGAVGNAKAFGRAYHTGGAPMTWETKHRTVCEVFGWPAPTFIHLPTDLLFAAWPERGRISAENFSFNNVFDNTAAERDLGYRYTISWRQGCERMKPVFLSTPGKIADPTTDPMYERVLAAWTKLSAQMKTELAAK